MIEKFFRNITGRKKRKLFAAWQVELTTRCPLLCRMCVRAERDDWHYQDMDFENFKRILPYMSDVETVVLEGWGESLLYKHLPDCIRLVKEQGPEVGFVTSAMGLTKDRVSEIVGAGLDFVGFSVAGTTSETHDAIRVNSSLPEVVHAIHLFGEEKLRRRLTRPKMHLVFLILKDNIREVPFAPSFARSMGIDEVALVNICHAINSWQEEQRIFTWGKEENPYEKYVRQAEMNASKLKIKLSRPSLRAADVVVCSEYPLRNLYIGADGAVSPCVYLYPPLSSPFKRIFQGRDYWVNRLSLGNIFEDPISAIWNSEGYVDFRSCFARREKKYKELYLSLLDGSRSTDNGGPSLPDPPEPCMTCHKMIGV